MPMIFVCSRTVPDLNLPLFHIGTLRTEAHQHLQLESVRNSYPHCHPVVSKVESSQGAREFNCRLPLSWIDRTHASATVKNTPPPPTTFGDGTGEFPDSKKYREARKDTVMLLQHSFSSSWQWYKVHRDKQSSFVRIHIERHRSQ